MSAKRGKGGPNCMFIEEDVQINLPDELEFVPISYQHFGVYRITGLELVLK